MITKEDIEAFTDSEQYWDTYSLEALYQEKQPSEPVTFEDYAELCHRASYNNGWWHDPDTGEELPTEGFLGAHVIGCKIGLIGSEVAEIMEGHRKRKMDDKLPQYEAVDVEIVDTMVRLFDLAGKRKTPLTEIFKVKMDFNDVRPDHQLEKRKQGGKLY